MDSTQRFTDRVEDYVKYRPTYPEAILTTLKVRPGWIVADIGSGTGISTLPFLLNKNRVFAVEPNAAMRKKAEELLGQYRGFTSIDGMAEKTGLADASVDLIVAGQSFHWFDRAATRREFIRISRPGATIALIWNERLTQTPFEQEYEDLILHFAGDYRTVNHKNIDDLRIGDFFQPQPFVLDQFDNAQKFDLAGLQGRLLSSSYIPRAGERHAEMIEALATLFEKYSADGKVILRYDTKMYSGVLRP
ncbi:MAG: class I SAM-dependent methyltransferase [Bacteroidetes bacterium]|nr:class I SAM-dependent methyltransferase [Bacteroidota bacterium]